MLNDKWIIDGHHYTCPECGNVMAIIENESDEGFDFCPFCGKRMSSQMEDDRLEVTHLMGKKLDKPIIVTLSSKTENKCGDCFWFTKTGNIYNIGYNICDHYCKLHYMQEMRYKNEKACGDFKERGSDECKS